LPGRLLWHDRRTGLLTQRSGDHDVVFMLEEGRLRFIRSTAEDHRLDRVITQLGKIPQDVLDIARETLQERRVPTRYGEILLEMGAIRPDETTVLVLTGSGLKASASIGELLKLEARGG